MWKKLRTWILDRIGKRAEHHVYRGYGNFDTGRGWWVGKRCFSYDE